MTEAIKTGTDVLRAMALTRVKTMRYGKVASEIGIHPDTLRDFAEGRRELPTDKLQAMALEMTGGHTCLDLETGMLKSTHATAPRSYIVPDAPTPVNYDAVGVATAPRLTLAAEQTKARPKRSGWLGGFF